MISHCSERTEDSRFTPDNDIPSNATAGVAIPTSISAGVHPLRHEAAGTIFFC
jgi:hypothetical protein